MSSPLPVIDDRKRREELLALANCAECPLAKKGRPHHPVLGEGPEEPLFIALGEGPGKVEAAEDRPFIGPSGQLLMGVFRAAGVEREQVYLANATACLPPREKSAAMLEKARECCAPRLKAELAPLPEDAPVLAVGAEAMRSCLGEKTDFGQTVSTYNLRAWPDPEAPQRAIIPTHHPAKIKRGAEDTESRGSDLFVWSLAYDIRKCRALAEGRPIVYTDDIETEMASPREAYRLVKSICDEAHRDRHVAIDVETDSFAPLDANLTAIGIATEKRGISVAYDLLSPKTKWGRLAWEELVKLCMSELVVKTFHNRIYDETVLREYGIEVRGRVEDTVLLDHNAFPGIPHKLESVATRHFAINPWKSEFRGGQMDTASLLIYNARDSLVTARLRPILTRAVDQAGTRETYEVDLQCSRIALEMGEVGVPIDWKVNRELHEHFQEIIQRTRAEIEEDVVDPEIREEWLRRLAIIRALKKRKRDPADFEERVEKRYRELRYGQRKKKKPEEYVKNKGPVEFQLSNADHIAAYLQAKGNALWQLTKGGKPSTAKDVLEGLNHLREVRTIIEFREADKLDGTFVRKLHVKGRGRWRRVHPTWNVHRITGRWSNRGLGMNWPKENKKGRPNLRRQMTARPGYLLVGADYDKLEARLIALLSGDPFLCRMLRGENDCGCGDKYCPKCDLHTSVAYELWGDEFLGWDKGYQKQLRDLCKRAEYGYFYGADEETMFQSLVLDMPHVTRAQVRALREALERKMPRIAEWHEELIRGAVEEKCVRSAILGRVRRFPLGNVDQSVIFNFPVQASAADIMNLGIIRLREMLPEGCRIIMQVHDAAIVECPEHLAGEVAETLKEALSQTHHVGEESMDFPADPEIGESWMRTDGDPDKEPMSLIDVALATHVPLKKMTRAIRWLYDHRIDPEFVDELAVKRAAREGNKNSLPSFGTWARIAGKGSMYQFAEELQGEAA